MHWSGASGFGLLTCFVTVGTAFLKHIFLEIFAEEQNTENTRVNHVMCSCRRGTFATCFWWKETSRKSLSSVIRKHTHHYIFAHFCADVMKVHYEVYIWVRSTASGLDLTANALERNDKEKVQLIY